MNNNLGNLRLIAKGHPVSSEPETEQVWQEPADRLLILLNTKPAGLETAEVQRRLAIYGPNDAATVKRSPRWLQFVARFGNPLIIILLIASAVSAATGDIASFVIIFVIVMLSIIFDFVQEVRAQNAVEALRQSVAVQAAAVRRDGTGIPVPDPPNSMPRRYCRATASPGRSCNPSRLAAARKPGSLCQPGTADG